MATQEPASSTPLALKPSTGEHWNKIVVQGIAKLRNDGWEDFTIICQGKEWKVHRFILSVQSPVLHKLCSSSFKEAQEKKADLPDDDPQCIEAMIDYIYTGNYKQPSPRTNAGSYSALKLHCMMVILADKYDLQPLKTGATEALKIAVDSITLSGQAYTSPTKEDQDTVKSLAETVTICYEAPSASLSISAYILSTIVTKSLFKQYRQCFAGLYANTSFATDLLLCYQTQMARVVKDAKAGRGWAIAGHYAD